MSKPVALCSADFHQDRADRGAWSRRPEIAGDSQCSLTQIVDYALQYSVPLMAAGDLFDTSAQEDSSALDHFLQQLDRLADKRLPFYFNQGQHDYLQGLPWLGLHPGATHVHRRRFKIGPFRAFGLDYTRPEDLSRTWEVVPTDTDILMTHQVWADLMGAHIGGECVFSDVPYATLLLTGDFHRHRVVDAINAHGKPMKVLSPGSICMRSINEEPDKAVFLLYDDLSVKSLPLKTRRLYRFRAANKAELADVLAQLDAIPEPSLDMPEAISKPIVHVTHEPDLADAHRKLQSACQNRFHLFLTPKSIDIFAGTDPASTAVEIGPAVNMRIGFDESLEKLWAKDSPEYVLASQLLSDENPSEALERAEAKFFTRPSSG